MGATAFGLDGAGDMLCGGQIEVRNHDCRAFISETPSGGRADAVGAAGDNSYLVCKATHESPPALDVTGRFAAPVKGWYRCAWVHHRLALARGARKRGHRPLSERWRRHSATS